ncbi:MAG: glycosyltransferase [Chitinophagaceae bacterium]|nr:glycosyltransferase [Chitinophagaceae bacterium]
MIKGLRVAVITNVLPTYRQGFYNRLFKRQDIHVTVFCQERIPGLNLKTIHDRYGEKVKLVRFFSAKGEKIAWQFLPWRKLIKEFNVIFIQGNPRYLSDFLLGTFLVLIKKNVVLWTMAHSSGANSFSERIRLFWSRIFSYIFVYTDNEVKYLRTRGFSNQYVLGMNNGLDQLAIDQVKQNLSEIMLNKWLSEKKLTGKTILLSCARLETKNRFDLFVKILPNVIERFSNVMWCIIGDGIERQNLEAQIAQAGLSEHVYFVGELYSEQMLCPWFLSSTLFIHPGAIGLSIMHAFGYGLPVVTNNNELRHYPEFGAFEDNKTGRLFEEDNTTDFSKVVNELLMDEKIRLYMKGQVLDVARNRFNVDIMVDRFINIANAAYANKKSDK